MDTMVSAPTSASAVSPPLDDKTLEDVLERWRRDLLTRDDKQWLSSFSLSINEYVNLTERMEGFGHGVELEDYHIHLNQYPTGLHKNIAYKISRLIDRTYGDLIDGLGSLSKSLSFSSPSSNILALPCGHGKAKQADASFAPVGLPAPNRHNNLKIRPGCSSPYPTMVVEIAYQNESLERLLQDAEEKHLSPDTNVNVWLGIKVNKSATGFQFWSGWGRRKRIGHGLRLVQQTEDHNGESQLYHVDAAEPIAGQFVIPTADIFHPLPAPAQVPHDLVIPLEQLRLIIRDATAWL
jgi:hypothetical protein